MLFTFLQKKSARQILIAFFLTGGSVIVSVVGISQEKRMLTPKDYILWETASKIKTNLAQVSIDGQWVVYSIKTTNGDSLFVRNIRSQTVFTFCSARVTPGYSHHLEYGSGNFSPNSNWFAVMDADSVRILHLKSGKKSSIRGTGFDFINQTDRIVIVRKETSSASILVHDLKSGQSHIYAGITSHQLNDDVSRIAVATDSASTSLAHVIELIGTVRSRIMARGSLTVFNGFKWNKAGDVIAFIERPKQEESNTAAHKIYLCDLKTEKTSISSFTPAASIIREDQKKGRLQHLQVSDDGKQLFFDIQETKYPESDGDTVKSTVSKPVQIWGAAALTIPPEDQKYNATYWYAWHTDGYLENLTNEDYPRAFVSGDQQNVMLYHKRGYLPQHNHVNSYADIYLKERRTGNSRLLVAKVKDQPDEFMTSPTGRFIGYFKQNHWWVYDFEKDTHACITQNMNIDWSSDKRTSTGTLPPYGSPGWLKNDQAFIIYDKYDIWVISPDGRTKRQITSGQQDNITFRIMKKTYPLQGPGGGNQWFSSRSYDSEEGLSPRWIMM